ncbi:hypothetical protein, partial [Agrobacterium pusense]|uniref:hypothetical protein n=1 Tax=Agrobacterium pusense TaxID=648995 RepID=UPI001AEC99D1
RETNISQHLISSKVSQSPTMTPAQQEVRKEPQHDVMMMFCPAGGTKMPPLTGDARPGDPMLPGS